MNILRVFLIFLLLCILLTCCTNSSAPSLASVSDSSIDSYTPNDADIRDSDTVDALVDLYSSVIKGVAFTNLTGADNKPVQYDNPGLVEEFISFIRNQTLTETDEKWDDTFKSELLGTGDRPILGITTGERAVTFDRDVNIGGTVYKKGVAYETGRWINNYMQKFREGSVLDPVHLAYPAEIEISATQDGYIADFINKGNRKINLYETLPRIHEFIEKHILCRKFEITGAKRYFDNESLNTATSEAENNEECIIIETSDNYIEITSSNKYPEYAYANSLIIFRSCKDPGIYKMIAGGMVFQIKVGRDFDAEFQELFFCENKSDIKLSPGDIIRLFKEKKPYYMDYICKNLGINSWIPRDDGKIQKKSMQLDSGKPYTVLELSDCYITRLIFFRGSEQTAPEFIDCIDFGDGRGVIDTNYHLVKKAGHTWIAGNVCKGRGTGVGMYYQDWYSLSGQGKKLVLSFPIDSYEQPPWGGYHIASKTISIADADAPSITIDYDLTKTYLLDIDSADEYGNVNVTSRISVKFMWDDAAGRFVSDYAGYSVEGSDITFIPAKCSDIAEKCDKLLNEAYDRLLGGKKAITGENKLEKEFKSRGLKYFLDDCSDSEKKRTLLELIQTDI